MKKKITIIVEAPTLCTEEQFEEWACFCLGYTGDIDGNNPLIDFELEADDIDFD